MQAVTPSYSTAVPRAQARTRTGGNPFRQDRLFLLGFLLCGVVCQIGLYRFGDTSLRMPMRIGVFAVSLGLLFVLPARQRSAAHPAARIVTAITLVLGLGIFMPGNAGWIAGFAQATLYVAVLAPLVWLPRLRIDRRTFRSVALTLWAFHSASAAVGVLQVRFPGAFDGALAKVMDDYQAGAMTIVLDNGTRVFRPMGLTDTPGGAGSSGVYAAVLGLGLLMTETSLTLRVIAVASMLSSLFSIYLSQGRTNLVVVLVAAIALVVVLWRRKEFRRATTLICVVVATVLIGMSLAFAVGGTMTIERWATLLADDPRTVAYQNRGQFIDQMVQKDIYDYPLGAGGGRWGMINGYFGDPKSALWAEIAWQALLYDGGLPLIVLYAMLQGLMIWVSWKEALASKNTFFGCWSATLVGLNLATIAASFVFPIYIKEAGLQVITLNACLFAAARTDAAEKHARLSAERGGYSIPDRASPTGDVPESALPGTA